jgi:hypothetical protein
MKRCIRPSMPGQDEALSTLTSAVPTPQLKTWVRHWTADDKDEVDLLWRSNRSDKTRASSGAIGK